MHVSIWYPVVTTMHVRLHQDTQYKGSADTHLLSASEASLREEERQSHFFCCFLFCLFRLFSLVSSEAVPCNDVVVLQDVSDGPAEALAA